jgi:hypothetical protein
MRFRLFGSKPTTSTTGPKPPTSGVGRAVGIGGAVLGFNAINSLTGGKFYDSIGLGFLNDMQDNMKLICGCCSCLLSLALIAFIAFKFA